LSLIMAFAYIFTNDTPDTYVLGLLLTLPLSYAGLRQHSKQLDSINLKKLVS